MTTEAKQPGEFEVTTDGSVSAQPKTPLDRLMGQRGIAKEDAAILLVDDEAAISRLGGRALTRATGIKAETAENGEEGLALIKSLNGRLLVVISDVDMPKKRGPAMIHDASAAQLLDGVAVVVMSGRMADNAKEIADSPVGGIDIVTLEKPFGPDELNAAVQRACQKVLDKMGKL